MNHKQLAAAQHIIMAVESLGKEAAKVRPLLDGDVEVNTVTALEVDLPEWFNEADYKTLGGDASKANGRFFKLHFRRAANGETELVIWCPTFLRGNGRLSVTVTEDGRVGGSY